MSNQAALNHANQAVSKAKQARAFLITSDGGVDRSDGSGGFGLQYLAEAVENLSRAVAFLAEQQP